MPIYCYRRPGGEIIERAFPMGEAPQSVCVNGCVAERDFQAEHSSVKELRGTAPGGWPMESNALALHPDQVPEQARRAREAGVPTDFKAGRPVLTDRSHRKRYCKFVGVRDNDGGYGDP